jgi:hypothetical protein
MNFPMLIAIIYYYLAYPFFKIHLANIIYKFWTINQ